MYRFVDALVSFVIVNDGSVVSSGVKWAFTACFFLSRWMRDILHSYEFSIWIWRKS